MNHRFHLKIHATFFRHLRKQRREVSNILKELKLQVNTKTTRLNVNAENIWNSALKGFDSATSVLQTPLK